MIDIPSNECKDLDHAHSSDRLWELENCLTDVIQYIAETANKKVSYLVFGLNWTYPLPA
jgi:hypothetical protein